MSNFEIDALLLCGHLAALGDQALALPEFIQTKQFINRPNLEMRENSNVSGSNERRQKKEEHGSL